MEDGTGYIANLVYMPGVTVDMFDWWFAWHGRVSEPGGSVTADLPGRER